jgi:hypothetical protein
MPMRGDAGAVRRVSEKVKGGRVTKCEATPMSRKSSETLRPAQGRLLRRGQGKLLRLRSGQALWHFLNCHTPPP